MSATMRDVQTARDLYALGASLREIASELGVNRNTVHCWVNPRAVRKHNARNQRARARQREAAFNERLVALREAGLSYEAISGAVKVYEGRTMSGDGIKGRLRTHAPHLPKKPRGKAFESVSA